MICYHTDNNVSHTVAKAFVEAGHDAQHIRNFYQNKGKPSIFYGILRGCGIAMRWCKAQDVDFWYVDNGYTDAQHVDQSGMKEMDGKYRIVKNDMFDVYDGQPVIMRDTDWSNTKVLFLPPSHYSAFMYDTTPQDWFEHYKGIAKKLGCNIGVRSKESRFDKSLEDHIEEYDAVFCFNSMAAITAIDMGKAVYTSHGIIRNGDMLGYKLPYYSGMDVKNFYKDKQFTLDEIREGAWNVAV